MMQSYDDDNNNNLDQSFDKNQNSTNNNNNNNIMDLESFIGKETQIQTLLPPVSSDLSNNKNDESELMVDSSSSGRTNKSSSLDEEDKEGDLLLPFGDELLLSIDNDPTITIHFSGTTNNKNNIASASDTTVTNMDDLNLNNKGIDDEIDTYIEALLSLNINTNTNNTMDGSQQQQQQQYNKNEIMNQEVVTLNKEEVEEIEEGGEGNVACFQCTSNDDYDGVCQLTHIFNKFTIDGSIMKKKKKETSSELHVDWRKEKCCRFSSESSSITKAKAKVEVLMNANDTLLDDRKQTKAQQPKEQRQQQINLNHYDVLFVRGKNQQLPGNIYYKSLISKNLKRYNECTKRQEKTLITWEIIFHIKKDVGGTFYENACEGEGEINHKIFKIEKSVKENDHKVVGLVKVPDLRVRKKISQAFRDLNRYVRKDT